MPRPLLMATNGIGPFRPDEQLYAGGYQGPMYPHPTVLSIPGFDPTEFFSIDAAPSGYELAADYPGLGKGNPNTNTANPGHILGLVDTFSRMAYGLGVVRAVRTVAENAAPVADVSIVFDPFGLVPGGAFGAGDLYPAMSEAPDAWVAGITDDDLAGIFRGRDLGYFPDSSPVDFSAFANFPALYFGLQTQFRSFLSSMAADAAGLADDLFLDVFGGKDVEPSMFPFGPSPTTHWPDGVFSGVIYNGNKALVESDALRLINGDGLFHDGPDGRLDPRSLHELAAVANLLPVRVNGFRQFAMDGDGTRNISYLYLDLSVNITVQEASTVTVSGVMKVDGTRIDSSGTWNQNDSFSRIMEYELESTNKYTWDRTWLGVGLNSQTVSDSASFAIDPPAMSGTPPGWEDYTELSFREELNLGPGCNNIRCRMFAQDLGVVVGVKLDDPGLADSDFWTEDVTVGISVTGGPVDVAKEVTLSGVGRLV